MNLSNTEPNLNHTPTSERLIVEKLKYSAIIQIDSDDTFCVVLHLNQFFIQLLADE